MDSMGPISKIPQKLSAVRQSETLLEYAKSRGAIREQETNARLEQANAATTAVETSIRGALVNKTSI